MRPGPPSAARSPAGLTTGPSLPTLGPMSSVAEWWQKETFIPRPDWAPPTAPLEIRRRRWPRRVATAVMILLLAAVGAVGALAWHYERSAAQWRALEQRQTLELARAQSQLLLSQSSTSQLESCITALQKSRPGLIAVILGEGTKMPAVCKTAEAIAGGSHG